MRKFIFGGISAIAALIAANGAFATTCSVEQHGINPSVSWVANAPSNMTTVVTNKLLLDTYAKDAEGKIDDAALPSAVLSCFGSDGRPIKAQRISIVPVAKTCPAAINGQNDDHKGCLPEYEGKVLPY